MGSAIRKRVGSWDFRSHLWPDSGNYRIFSCSSKHRLSKLRLCSLDIYGQSPTPWPEWGRHQLPLDRKNLEIQVTIRLLFNSHSPWFIRIMYNIRTNRLSMFLSLTGVLDWINNLNANLTPTLTLTLKLLEPGRSIVSEVSVPARVANCERLSPALTEL